jgi:hypothetical protein
MKEYLVSAALAMPVAYHPRMGSARIRRISACGTLNFYASLAGVAALALAPGCLVPPFFVVICPAIGVLGVAAGVAGVVSFIACG